MEKGNGVALAGASTVPERPVPPAPPLAPETFAESFQGWVQSPLFQRKLAGLGRHGYGEILFKVKEGRVYSAQITETIRI
jgi:hypothetical protein